MAGTAALISAGHSSQHVLDVRDRAAWDLALAAFAEASGGRIDVVFNNAGIPIGGRIVDCSTEEVERTLDINLKGVIFGAQAAYPWLKASAPGSCLLNTASAAGIYGVPGGSVYSATKFGVRSITESLDGEWREDGILVRDLMPSFIETPLLDLAPNRASNQDIRSGVTSAGLEITPVSDVAEAAWAAVHGQKVHTLVGYSQTLDLAPFLTLSPAQLAAAYAAGGGAAARGRNTLRRARESVGEGPTARAPSLALAKVSCAQTSLTA
jgi:NAD(P)-dependent dehydrogenase (short-subunit alcohol dehydrogenase family)